MSMGCCSVPCWGDSGGSRLISPTTAPRPTTSLAEGLESKPQSRSKGPIMTPPDLADSPPEGSPMSRLMTLRRTIAMAFALLFLSPACARGGVTSEQVERAIREGIRFLKAQQQPDGSWTDAEAQVKTGTTSLVTLALITAGEKAESPAIQNALAFLREFGPQQLRNTYAIGLQTMVFAAAEPERDRLRLLANADWLQQSQLKPGDRMPWPGT